MLSNFICDAGSQSPDRILDQSNNELTSHVQTLVSFCQSNPQVRVAVVPPLARSVPEWFNPYLPCFTAFLFGEITKAGCDQIRYLSPFVAPPHFFTSDGVHLNQDAGIQFIRFIIDGVDQILPNSGAQNTPFISVSSQSSHLEMAPYTSALPSLLVSSVPQPQPSTAHLVSSVPHSQPSTSGYVSLVPSVPPPISTSSASFAVEFSRISSALVTLTGVTDRLGDAASVRRQQDNLIFARLKEDRDFEFNKNREDRFTVTGLTVSRPPSDPKERKDFFRQKLQDLVDSACPDVDPHPVVLDVFVNMRYVI